MKKILMLTLLLIGGLVLQACGGSTDDNLDDDGVELEEGTIRVKAWVHVSQETEEGRAYKDRVDAFNQEYEGEIYASVSYIPRGGGASGYEEKVIAAHTTDTLPDVITLDGPNTSAYAIADIITPLDQYISAEDRNDYLTSILEQGTYDGRIYSLGQMESTVGLYYNRAMFDHCGITAATIDSPWTWAEFRANTEALDNCLGQGAHALDLHFYDHTEWLTYALTPFLWTNEGRLVSPDGLEVEGYFDSPENVESLEFLQDMYDDGLVFDETANRPFHNGLIAMSLGGPWVIQELQTAYPNLQWGIMPYPKKDNNSELYAPTGSWAFGVTNSSENKEEAATFVQWMTNKETTIRIHEATGMLPSRKSALNELEYYNDVNSPHYVLRRQLEEYGRARPSTPSYPTVTNSFKYVIEALTAGMNIEEALESRIAEIERDLRRFR